MFFLNCHEKTKQFSIANTPVINLEEIAKLLVTQIGEYLNSTTLGCVLLCSLDLEVK